MDSSGRGQPNHFKVTLGDFYHYSVALSYDDGSPVDDGKGIGRKVIDKLQQTYDFELAGRELVYDGEKSLFTVDPLPQNKLEFTVILQDLSSNKAVMNGSPVNESSLEVGDRKRSFKVEISIAAKIPMRAIANALCGQESENSIEALRVLDIILPQNAAKQGCPLVRQLFFHNRPRNFCDLGGGVLGCRGFHSSFRSTQGGLSLNIVLDFLVANQSVRDLQGIDWAKERQMLKTVRINPSPANMEYKMTGLSDLPCNQQLFSLRQRTDGNAEDEVQTPEVTSYDYFVNDRHIQSRYSGDLPSINVGKPNHLKYIPPELCSLVSLQRVAKPSSTFERSPTHVEKSRQQPQERMSVLCDTSYNYGLDGLLHAAGVSISSSFSEIEGCVLSTPKLKLGSGEDFFPQSGRLNYNHKGLRMEALPHPPPLPLNTKHHAKLKLDPMDSSGFARRGQPINLFTNHFKLTAGSVDCDVYLYNVALYYDDGSPVDDGKGIGRKVIDKLQQTYDMELAGRDFCYDGEMSLFTVGPFPQNKFEFTVILEDLSSNKAVRAVVNGSPVNESSVEVGDRKRIRRRFQSRNFKVEISCVTKIPMRAIANSLCSQESENSQKALRVLDITLRQNAAKKDCLLVLQSFFHNRPRNFCDFGSGVLGCRGFNYNFMAAQDGLPQKTDVSETGMNPSSKALSTLQRSSLVEKSRPNPQERMSDLSDVLVNNNYGVNELLYSTGVSSSSSSIEIEGRVLSAPKLKVGNGEVLVLSNGRWNYGHKELVQPTKIEDWAIVNFSVCCDIEKICRDLARCAQQKGICVDYPYAVIEENPQARCAPALGRVEQMFEKVNSKLPQRPRFLLCLLPESKTSTIYGIWKRKAIADFGIVTQCISPLRVNDQYLSNVALEMNAKLGGFNCSLAEQPLSILMISKYSGSGSQPIPSIGTGIALIIHDGRILGTCEGRSTLDVESVIKYRGPEEEILEGVLDPNLGKILIGNQQKFCRLGKSILVTTTWASICFGVAIDDLFSQCGEEEDVKIEKAIDICCVSIQKLLSTRDFNATVTLCGFQLGKPVIVHFQNMKRGDICKEKMQVTKEELKLVALGSGRSIIEKHIKRCNLASYPELSVETLFKHLEVAVFLCGLKDRGCGGVLSVAFVDSDSNVSIHYARHTVSALATHYNDMKMKWSKRLLYKCHSQLYGARFEKKVVETLSTILFDGGLPGVDEFSTHVLGVRRDTNEIVGVIGFSDADTVKAVYEIVSNHDWNQFFNFYEVSNEILQELGSMFNYDVQDQINYL